MKNHQAALLAAAIENAAHPDGRTVGELYEVNLALLEDTEAFGRKRPRRALPDAAYEPPEPPTLGPSQIAKRAEIIRRHPGRRSPGEPTIEELRERYFEIPERVGAPVTFDGVRIGSVRSADLTTNPPTQLPYDNNEGKSVSGWLTDDELNEADEQMPTLLVNNPRDGRPTITELDADDEFEVSLPREPCLRLARHEPHPYLMGRCPGREFTITVPPDGLDTTGRH